MNKSVSTHNFLPVALFTAVCPLFEVNLIYLWNKSAHARCDIITADLLCCGNNMLDWCAASKAHKKKLFFFLPVVRLTDINHVFTTISCMCKQLCTALCRWTTKKKRTYYVFVYDSLSESVFQRDKSNAGKQQFRERWCMIKRESSIDFPQLCLLRLPLLNMDSAQLPIWLYLEIDTLSVKGYSFFNKALCQEREIVLTQLETEHLICYRGLHISSAAALRLTSQDRWREARKLVSRWPQMLA